MSDDALRALFGATQLATLATLRRDGRPQLSQVSYAYDQDAGLLRFSTTAGRAKTHNLRRDPRATVLVAGPDRWSYAVADVRAQLLPEAARPGDASLAELVDIYRAISGEHPDWDDYARAMIADRRLPVHLHIERVYGAPAR